MDDKERLEAQARDAQEREREERREQEQRMDLLLREFRL